MKNKVTVKDKSFKFALEIIALYQKLILEKEYILSKQLLRSGTSIGANVREASAAQSRKDFIHKMSIASKEARETEYWLQLLSQSSLTKVDVSNEIEKSIEIIKMLTAIVKRALIPKNFRKNYGKLKTKTKN